ncbi:MAG: hypothetical protein HYX94_13185, partial [Chloroflexi bacterium]|nr:hypothetical protein [Chloroflexota bacterium]
MDLPPTSWRVQVVAGLFKFDPPNGWGLNRRQLAVTYNAGSSSSVNLRTVEYPTSGWPRPSEALYVDSNSRFWLAAGGFRGSGLTGSDPRWSLALATWRYYYYTVRLFQPGQVPSLKGEVVNVTRSTDTPGARLPVVATDPDGDTMYLGAPVHLTLENVVATDYLMEEPPKHTYWDPVAKKVVNVSRYPSFNVSLRRQTGTEFSSENRDTADHSIGTSLATSASATVEWHSSVVMKAATEVSAGFSAKIGYDYDSHKSSYQSNYASQSVTFSGETALDDYAVFRTQAIDIWRYRVYGMTARDPQGNVSNAFLDIVLPRVAGTLRTEAGASDFDWYQPTHENGNILSYPPYDSTTTFHPADLGEFQLGTEITSTLLLEMQPKTGNMQRPANSVPTRRSELFARPAVAPHIVPKSGCDSPPL